MRSGPSHRAFLTPLPGRSGPGICMWPQYWASLSVAAWPLRPAAALVFQDGSSLPFLQPFANTELIHICTQIPPPLLPLSLPCGPAGDTQGPDTQVGLQGPWSSAWVSKAVGLSPCPQDSAELEGQLGELGRWTEAAVQSQSPRKGRGEKDQGALYLPEALCTGEGIGDAS